MAVKSVILGSLVACAIAAFSDAKEHKDSVPSLDEDQPKTTEIFNVPKYFDVICHAERFVEPGETTGIPMTCIDRFGTQFTIIRPNPGHQPSN